MTKEQLVSTIAGATGVTKKDTTAVIDAFCTAIGDAMRVGEKVTLTGFGTFEAKVRDARDCKNPATGETIHVASHKVPHFKAGKNLKDSLL